MVEIWKQHLGKGNLVGVLLVDLSKVIDTISQSLLLTKLEAHAFLGNFLKLLQG